LFTAITCDIVLNYFGVWWFAMHDGLQLTHILTLYKKNVISKYHK